MKRETEFEDDELLIAWMKKDSQLESDDLENKIMTRIVPKAVPVRKAIKIPKAMIVVGYCLLTFVTLALCLWIDVFAQFQIPLPEWQPMAEDKHYYIGVITGALVLAVLCFVSYWRKLGRWMPKH